MTNRKTGGLEEKLMSEKSDRFKPSELWPTLKAWKQYGIEQGFDERNPSSVRKSDILEERSWYNRGVRKTWIPKFSFEYSFNQASNLWSTLKTWKQYGIKHGFDERNPSSFRINGNLEERAWYGKGVRKKWLNRFEFEFAKTDASSNWQNLKTWKQYGIEQGFDERNPSSIVTSDNSEERAWYGRGVRKKWLPKFQFERKYTSTSSNWQNLKTWKQYGIEQGFDERNPSSLSKSDSPEERSWYYRGNKQKWLTQFPFQRKGEVIPLEKTLQDIPEAKTIGRLSLYTDDISGIAQTLSKLYPNRFPSAAQLARLLPKAVRSIAHSLTPFLLSEAREFHKKTRSLPSEIRYSLDNLLYTILVDQYEPQFNQNPKGTLTELRQFAKQNKSNGLSTLASKVLEYYKSAYTFNIPGYGSIKNYTA